METIQLQCGSCGQMMGIDAAHLGSQVQCPHCQAVVQTPAPPGQLGASAPNSTLQFSMPEAGERESIFGQPEPVDDLFEAPPPRIEMPPMETPPAQPSTPQPASFSRPAPVSSYEQTVTMEPVAPRQPYEHTDHAAMFEQPAANDIAPIVPRSLPRRSNFMPILLIFLIPYSICTTLFVAYLIWMSNQHEHPLKMLPDPTKDGTARRVRISFNADLPNDLKIGLGQTLRIGAIEITPQEVKRISTGDLMLVFRARNVSEDQVFTPIADQWLRYSGRSMTEPKPYTFLERPKNEQRVFGGNLEWVRGAGAGNRFTDGELEPGQEAVVRITTEEKYRPIVQNMVAAPERLLWRVQVRRGLISFEDKEISVTAVFGVDFSTREIVKHANEG